MTILGADLHQGQLDIVRMIQGQAKYVTCVAPRQTGKSFMATQVILYWALNNPNAKIFWVSPTYAQARKPFDEILEGVFKANVIKSANKSTMEMKFNNGAIVYFKSVERPDFLRGYTADFMACDEAAYYTEEVWASVLKPMLLVRGRKCLFISTPRGSNWFKQMYDLGQSEDHPEYASCRMHYSQNPFIDKAEIEEAKRTLPEHIFAAEYEGSFVDSGTAVFTNIEATQFTQWPRGQGRHYAGVDLGRQGDYTCCTIVDETGKVIEVYRDNQREWSTMIDNIILLLRKYNAKALVEANGIGDVVFEQIKKQYKDAEPFITSSTSKQQIIESLIVAFNTQAIKIPAKELFAPLAFELSIFEYQYSARSRTVQYSAPHGFNDDTVMSLAIAWRAKEAMANTGSYVVAGKRLY